RDPRPARRQRHRQTNPTAHPAQMQQRKDQQVRDQYTRHPPDILGLQPMELHWPVDSLIAAIGLHCSPKNDLMIAATTTKKIQAENHAAATFAVSWSP